MPRNQKRQVEEEEEDIEEEAPQFSFDMADGVEKSPAQLEEGARKIIDALPAGVQKRVKFLRKLQGDHDKLQAQFEEELKELEKKYEALYNPLYARRKEIITGASEVSEAETKQAQEYDEEAKKKLEAKKEGEAAAEPTATTTTQETLPEDAKGIPNFWLHVLLKSEVNEEMIQEHDKDSLKYLVDVTAENVELPVEGSEKKQKGFVLKFTFKENPYFTNTVLTKTYFLSGEDDSTIEKSEGCTIEWKEGQDLTVTIKTKKQKHKSGKHTRTVQQTLPRDSFYNFFKELKFEVDEEEDEEEAEERFEQLMDADAEIGSVMRDRIIPHAVQYYLGEMQTIDVDEMVARMGLGGDNYDELDEEDEEEEEPQPKKGGKGGRGGARGGRGGAQGGQQQQECKQQ